jgi:hypothetical protein
MSKSVVVIITILFHLSGFRCFKHFYIYYVQEHMKEDFPNTVSYNRFTELMQSTILSLTMILKIYCLYRCTGISFVDSIPIRVCLLRPSDSTSQSTPLHLTNTSHCKGVFGTYTLELPPMLGTKTKEAVSFYFEIASFFELVNQRKIYFKLNILGLKETITQTQLLVLEASATFFNLSKVPEPNIWEYPAEATISFWRV